MPASVCSNLSLQWELLGSPKSSWIRAVCKGHPGQREVINPLFRITACESWTMWVDGQYIPRSAMDFVEKNYEYLHLGNNGPTTNTFNTLTMYY
jgi:hypothetical protein